VSKSKKKVYIRESRRELSGVKKGSGRVPTVKLEMGERDEVKRGGGRESGLVQLRHRRLKKATTTSHQTWNRLL